MARYHDVGLVHQGWIHDLVKLEIHPETERILQSGKSFDPQQLVEESAIQFLTELRALFEEYLSTFNAYSENGTQFHEIKLYNVAQTPSDFMLFRNQIKLIFSNSSQGVIEISFSQHLRGNLAVDGQTTLSQQSNPLPPQGPAQELLAQIGPFRDVYWTFQGEKVTPEQVAKFYLVEFVRFTRVSHRSRTGNQVLLEQIKAILQEKGLSL